MGNYCWEYKLCSASESADSESIQIVSLSHTMVAEMSVTKECAICGRDLKPYIVVGRLPEKMNFFGITKSKDRIAFKCHNAMISLAQLNSEGFLPLSSVGPEYNF